MEPSEITHREADERLERIEEKIDDIPTVVKAVIGDGDYLLPGGASPRDLLADHAMFHEINGRLIAALDGPEIQKLDGTTTRLKEQGLVWQGQDNGTRLGRIEVMLGNGIKTKMDPVVKGAIITASAAVTIAAIPFIRDLF